jgi:GDPmannose 4,6-dehydratase
VDILQGDATKAKKVLRWEPKVCFQALAGMMTDTDREIAERGKALKETGLWR